MSEATSTTRTGRDRARQVTAGLLTAALVTLIPALLAVLVGWPLPSRVPTGQDVPGWVTSPLTSGAVVDVLAVVAWAAWAHFMACLGTELINATVRRDRPGLRVPFGGISQAAAGRLVAAVLLLGASAPIAAAPATAAHLAPTAHGQPVATAAELHPAGGRHPSTEGADLGATTAGPSPAPTVVWSARAEAVGPPSTPDLNTEEALLRRYTVAAPNAGYHENLWDIAERHLGDGMRWAQIYQLNTGRPQPDGQALTDPDMIRPGWQLRMPVDATDLPSWTETPEAPQHARADGTLEPSSGRVGGAAEALIGARRQVLVAEGDTLWDIAEEQLGDGTRYDELAVAAGGLVQPDGTRLADPDLIRPGWVIPIPPATSTQAPAPAPTAETAPRERAPAQDEPEPAQDEPEPAQDEPEPAQDEPEPAQDEPEPPQDEATADPEVAASPAPVGPGDPEARPEPAATTRADRTPARPDAGGKQQTGHEQQEEEQAGPVAAVAGGAVLLAGGVFAALLAARRRQFRCRRPGRTITPAPAGLVPVERALLVDGPRGVVEGELLDLALRDLAARLAAGPDGMPDVIAARMDPDGLDLRLRHPRHTPPSPWTADGSGLWWSVPATATFAPTLRAHQLAPCPTLVTVAHRGGSRWMVDLEAAASVALRGPATRCADLARFIAAELAVNAWSDQVTVTLVGFGDELVDLCPTRLRVQADAAAALAAVRADLDEHHDLRARAGVDGLACRVRDVAGDSWMPHVILLAPHALPDGQDAADLLAQLASSPGRLAVAVVLAGYDGPARVGLELHLDDDGGLRIDDLGLSATGEALDADDAVGMARLLAAARDGGDVEMPSATGTAAWTRFAATDGSLRRTMTTPRGHGDSAMEHPTVETTPDADADTDGSAHADETTCLLPEPDQVYLAAGATTGEDLATLAPNVPASVRSLVEDADPTLDDDLAAWWADDGDLPRLTLLGPIRVRALGQAPPKRTAFYTELVAYLATRPNGATSEQVADAFRLQPNTARTAVNVVRTWLGTNPRTGRKHLPDALQSAAGRARGVGVYQVENLLVDCDLLRRLRLRGQARGGTEGLADLTNALRLVTGEPFAQMRPGGGTWITEGERIDHHLTAAIVDIAHTVVSAALAAGDTGTARVAAETALLAAPHDEIPHLDLAAVHTAEGDKSAAELALRLDVIDRCDDADAPMDPPERTTTILTQRDWLTTSG